MSEENNTGFEIEKSFEHALNRHGFGFQYRVIKETQRALEKGKSGWRFLASEVPVEVRSAGTRIDFILEQRMDGTKFWELMICECKRVNPALGRWLFVRAPVTRRGYHIDQLTMESAKVSHGVLQSSGLESAFSISKTTFHIALPVKCNVKGVDQYKGSNDAVEEAVGQVLRGMNGYINLLGANHQAIGNRMTLLLPVVFTTAELWVCDADLSEAELSTGTLTFESGAFKRVDWLWFQYHSSPGTKHSFSPDGRPEQIEKLIGSEYVRTVGIVGPEGIGDFLAFTTETVLR